MLASSQELKSSAMVNGTLTHIKPFKLRTPFAFTSGSLALLYICVHGNCSSLKMGSVFDGAVSLQIAEAPLYSL